MLQPFYQAFDEYFIGLSNKSIQFKEQKEVLYILQVLQNAALWLGKYVYKSPMTVLFSNIIHQNNSHVKIMLK